MDVPDNLGFLYRPVEAGLLPPAAWLNPRYDLNDFADANEWLDVRDENRFRIQQAMEKK